jgi:hypothetical protein
MVSGQQLFMRDKLLEDLRLSASIVLAGEEVTPRFLVICPDGDWTVLVPLPEDIGVRQLRMQLLYGFMAWKSAVAFIMSSQLATPSVIASIGVDRDGVQCAVRPLLRKPRTLGPIEWWPQERIGPEIVALLPRGRVCIDPQTESDLVRTFGAGGELEARPCLRSRLEVPALGWSMSRIASGHFSDPKKLRRRRGRHSRPLFAFP